MDIYKALYADNLDDQALPVYIAMCQYKLDYYDASIECLQPYLQLHPSSPIAVNLQASNHCLMFENSKAIAALEGLVSDSADAAHDQLTRHNTVVFNKGEIALQVLPELQGVVPEALLNLVRSPC